jgi:hypothetical protein
MNVNIASEIYREKYGPVYSFEYYIDSVKRGIDLLQSNGLEKKCDTTERKAINMALEYSNEEMIAALSSL